jgi:hypothetical protein
MYRSLAPCPTTSQVPPSTSPTPVVGLVSPEMTITPNPYEVDDVFEVPLDFLMNPENHRLHGLSAMAFFGNGIQCLIFENFKHRPRKDSRTFYVGRYGRHDSQLLSFLIGRKFFMMMLWSFSRYFWHLSSNKLAP